MVKQFFKCFFRLRTYETEYWYEVARIIFHTLVFVAIVIVCRVVLAGMLEQKWLGLISRIVHIVYHIIYVFVLCKMLQISANRKYATPIKPQHIPELMKAYQQKRLYCKVNGKYKTIKSKNDVKEDDEIILIMIGKKELMGLKKYKKIIGIDGGDANVQKEEKNIAQNKKKAVSDKPTSL